jgi:uncharacterized membrane protein
MRLSIIAGIGVGLATGAWMFSEYALGLHDDPAGAGRWTGFLSLVFPVLGAYWIVARSGLSSWTGALREGLVFGVVGGLLGGAAIYLYFTVVNPGFGGGSHAVDAGAQALAGFAGAIVLGPLLTLILYAVIGRRRRANV